MKRAYGGSWQHPLCLMAILFLLFIVFNIQLYHLVLFYRLVSQRVKQD